MTHIVVIGGSNRAEAQSHRIAEAASEKLRARLGAAGSVDLVSLRDIEIPLWDESKWAADKPADSFWAAQWPALSARLKAADGFVVVTPEWHGMASPGLKNLICCCDGKELAFKPAYLIGVSVGSGGAYPIAELRMNAGKNTYIQWQPDHLIVRNADQFLVEGGTAPEWLEGRMDHGLEILVATAAALKPVRETVVNLELLKTGM
ncbi:MAG: NAD(P)H-dependent oxidoreductase [Pseudomonadota bacterium]